MIQEAGHGNLMGDFFLGVPARAAVELCGGNIRHRAPTFFSAADKESIIDDGTSSVTPPSTTSFNPGAALALIAGCMGTEKLVEITRLTIPGALKVLSHHCSMICSLRIMQYRMVE